MTQTQYEIHVDAEMIKRVDRDTSTKTVFTRRNNVVVELFVKIENYLLELQMEYKYIYTSLQI